MLTIAASPIMAERWATYRRDFDYATEIDYVSLCRAAASMLAKVISAMDGGARCLI